MAHIVTPQADAEGNIVDFEVTTPTEGYNPNAYREFQDGSIHHEFENVEVNEDAPDEYLEEYYDTLASTYPDLHEALEWSADHLPPEAIDEYNQAIDNDDLERINEVLEYIINAYRQDEGVEEQPTEDESDEENPLTEEETQELHDIFTDFAQREPGGEEQAEYWQAVVDQAQEVGNETFAAVAAATSAFHAGEVSAEEAFSFLLENYDIHDLQQVYNQLQG